MPDKQIRRIKTGRSPFLPENPQPYENVVRGRAPPIQPQKYIKNLRISPQNTKIQPKYVWKMDF